MRVVFPVLISIFEISACSNKTTDGFEREDITITDVISGIALSESQHPNSEVGLDEKTIYLRGRNTFTSIFNP
ncbi:MAG: hypothetical protein COA99_04445 [Moraxellaceae bacterium]|nr:MAG: hypothetical protein COA99_04445 [Moraxellaceae bacterium]